MFAKIILFSIKITYNGVIRYTLQNNYIRIIKFSNFNCNDLFEIKSVRILDFYTNRVLLKI